MILLYMTLQCLCFCCIIEVFHHKYCLMDNYVPYGQFPKGNSIEEGVTVENEKDNKSQEKVTDSNKEDEKWKDNYVPYEEEEKQEEKKEEKE